MAWPGDGEGRGGDRPGPRPPDPRGGAAAHVQGGTALSEMAGTLKALVTLPTIPHQTIPVDDDAEHDGQDPVREPAPGEDLLLHDQLRRGAILNCPILPLSNPTLPLGSHAYRVCGGAQS